MKNQFKHYLRYLLVMLALVMSTSLVSCGDDEDEPDPGYNEEQPSEPSNSLAGKSLSYNYNYKDGACRYELNDLISFASATRFSQSYRLKFEECDWGTGEWKEDPSSSIYFDKEGYYEYGGNKIVLYYDEGGSVTFTKTGSAWKQGNQNYTLR